MSLLGNGTSNSTHVGPQGFVDGGPVFNSALALLMFQLLLITFVSRCFGWLFRKLREPMVIAEMCAGIVLVRALRSWFRHCPFVARRVAVVSSLRSTPVGRSGCGNSPIEIFC
jgi:hypothetical protein